MNVPGVTTAGSSGTAANRPHDGALVDGCIARARALAPTIAAAASQIEAGRELTPEVVAALLPRFIHRAYQVENSDRRQGFAVRQRRRPVADPHAETQLASSRVFRIEALRVMVAEASQTGAPGLEARIMLRVASSNATHQARAVVDTAYDAAVGQHFFGLPLHPKFI